MTCSVLLALTIEIVPLTIRGEQLQVLLAHQQTGWRLPGGPPNPREDLDAAARRYLAEQVDLHEIYLEQLYTFGQPEGAAEQLTVAVAYYALLPIGSPPDDRPLAHNDASWVPVDALPDLPADHVEIVRLAHRRLASKLAYSTIVLQLMPEQFTLSELQTVNEIVLDEPLDKRNFRKRMLTLDCIEATGKMERRGGRRPARLFRAKRPGQIDFIK